MTHGTGGAADDGGDPAADDPTNTIAVVGVASGATRIVIVRHGETTWGAQSRFAGRRDVPLSDRGIAEATSVAERVSRLSPAAVLSSPLQRCTVTAAVIGRETGAPVTEEDGLLDGELGDWSGFTAEQIEQRWPAEFARWRGDPDAAPPGGESFSQIRDRVAVLLADVVRRFRSETVVLVTHAAAAKMILVTALDAPTAVAYRLRVDTASVSGLTVQPDGATVVWAVNEIGHLPD